MMKKQLIQIVTAASATVLISACGGGSGGSSAGSGQGTAPPPPPPPPPPPAFEASVSSEVNGVAENSSETLEYSFSGAQGGVTANYTYDSDVNVDVNITETISANRATYEITVGDMEVSNRSIDFDVTFTDGDGRSQSFNKTFEAINTSGEAEKENYQRLVKAASEWKEFSTEALVIERLERLASLVSRDDLVISSSEVEDIVGVELISDFNETLSLLESNIDYYENQEGIESAFDSAEKDIIDLANSISVRIAARVNSLANSTQGVATQIPSNGVFYTDSLGLLSPYVGNEEVGSFEGQEWQFNADFEYLQDIVFTSGLTCDIK
jgi:hypothetical protein